MLPRPSRGLLDFVAAVLCLWAAAYHTPVGAMARGVVAWARGSQTSGGPWLSYYAGGVYDAPGVRMGPPREWAMGDPAGIAGVPPGRAVGRGVFWVASRLAPPGRAVAEGVAARFHRSLESPDDAAAVVDQARARLGSEEAAVLAVFAGLEAAEYATARAKAEGQGVDRLEVLAALLPPSAAPAVESASTALSLGTAWGLGWPISAGAPVSSPFGWRTHPFLGQGQFHPGVDLSVPEGTEVRAAGGGVVRRAREDGLNGWMVVIDHGRGVATAYCHNSRLLVVEGQSVRAGQPVAESGTTGRSTGPHLHYQLELGRTPVDPLRFREARDRSAKTG